MLAKFQRKKNNLPLPSQILTIILSYAHDLPTEMIKFCKDFGWDACINLIHAQDKSAKESLKLSQDLLKTLRESENISKISGEKILFFTSAKKEENQKALELKMADHKQEIERMVALKTNDMRGKIARLQNQIEAAETAGKQQLEQIQMVEQQAALDALQQTMRTSATIGLIAKERAIQANAKHELDKKRRELENSDFYFLEIYRMEHVLKKFIQAIDGEIAKKWYLSNRIRFKTSEEIYVNSVSTLRLIEFMCLFWLLYAFLSYIAVLSIYPIFIAVFFPHSTLLSLFLIPAIAVLAITGLYTLGVFLLQVDNQTDNQRFEDHFLSSSFSTELNENFNEIKNKLEQFQEVNDALEEEKASHPLLTLTTKSKISDIRQAMSGEVTFFNKLYKQSTRVEESVDEEKTERLDW